jgi:Zn-dependent metalloprotease
MLYILAAAFLLLVPCRDGVARRQVNQYRYLEINNLKIHPTIIRTQDALSPLSNEAGSPDHEYNINRENTSQAVADNFIKQNISLFGIRNYATNIQTEKIQKSPAGDHITYYEILQGIPVYDSKIVITINHEKKVSFVASHYRSVINLKDAEPRISATSAIQRARDYLNVSGRLLAKQIAELIVFESKYDGVLLTFRVQIPVSEPRGDWEIFVDAVNGDIVHVKNCMMFGDGVTGSGAVWAPDPLTMAGQYYGGDIDVDGDFIDNGDRDHPSLNDQRIIVPLNDLTYVDSLKAYVLEGPYVKLVDIESPYEEFPYFADPNSFIFTREEQGFEDVMVYYHIDQSYRRLLNLGFSVNSLMEFEADPHGFSGEDNSYYSRFGNFCVFGEGGVDDAEDAAIIWHEYAHAIQNNISVANYNYGDETFSLLEGCSDYWAVSNKRRVSPSFGWEEVFLWDAGIRSAEGDTTFWAGRRCDLDWHYPEDYMIFAGTHEGGQIWSSALMHIWGSLGAEITDKLFIASHYFWGPHPGFEEAAQAFIQADRNINDGINLAVISQWFDHHGLINILEYQPHIVHQPLPDTEDLIGPYTILCQIIPVEAGLDSTNLWLIWGNDSTMVDSLKLQASGNNYYTVAIPGVIEPEQVNYYIYAGDSVGLSAASPADAPLRFHSFYAGPDTIPPEILHTPVKDLQISSWPAEVSAVVTDNIGIDSVWVEYMINDSLPAYSFPLTEIDSGLYTGPFYPDSGNITADDTVFYRLLARDSSSNFNEARHPSAGFHSFAVYQRPPAPANVQINSEKGNIILTWDVVEENDNIFYKIFKSDSDSNFSFLDSTTTDTYTDTSVILGDRHFYYLRTISGQWESDPSDTVDALVEEIVSLEKSTLLPVKFALWQNFPNPFNPSTVISWQLAASSNVDLSIFNLLGQKVVTLISENQPAGYYQVEWDATNFASGIYYYRLEAGEFREVKKMILIR